jgi:hypothetical protein
MPNYEGHEDDFNLCINIWKSITDRYGGNALADDFNMEERGVVLVVYVEGVIYRDGFEGLFASKLPGDPFYKLTLDAFEQIGCKEAKETLNEALKLFPNAEPPKDDEERMKQYLTYSENVRNSINSKFWRSHESIYKCLANYIRERIKLFASYEHVLGS